jgi:hypothetical protein
MPRGGKREGAGRKPKPKVALLPTDIAREVMAELPQKELWKSLVADPKTRLQAMTYLTDRSFGRVPMGIALGVFNQTPGSEDQPLIQVNFTESTHPGAGRGRTSISNEFGAVAVFEDGRLIEVRRGAASTVEGQIEEAATYNDEIAAEAPTPEPVAASPIVEVLPPERTLPAPTPFQVQQRQKLLPIHLQRR